MKREKISTTQGSLILTAAREIKFRTISLHRATGTAKKPPKECRHKNVQNMDLWKVGFKSWNVELRYTHEPNN